jgi:putative hydrolase of HD superfamily
MEEEPAQALLALLFYGNRLKRMPRTGWVQRGVVDAEDVAAHTYGVAWITLLLAESVAPPPDRGRALEIALVHDLPEALTGDIPPSVWRLLPAGSKPAVEGQALAALLGDLPFAPRLAALWQEYRDAESPEARLVHDADRLDLFVQALTYERQAGNRQLAEFWDWKVSFYYPESLALYELLARLRAEEGSGGVGE